MNVGSFSSAVKVRFQLLASALVLCATAVGVESLNEGTAITNGFLLEQCGRLLAAGSWGPARERIGMIKDPNPVEGVCIRLYESRLALVDGRFPEAEAGFAACLESSVPVPSEIFVGALVGASEVMERRGETNAATRALLQFLKSGREIPDAEPVFQRLVALLSESTHPAEADLRDCLRMGPKNHRALAQFYLAQFYFATGRQGKAVEEITQFCENYPDHSLCAAAFLQRGERAMEVEQWTAAESLLKRGLRASTEASVERSLSMRLALVAFRKGLYADAREQYTRMGQQWPELEAETAFNAGLSSVRLGDLRAASMHLSRLLAAQGAQELAVQLELEIALRRAVDFHPQAEESLQTFIRTHPQSSRVSDARIALAELYMTQSGQDLPEEGPRSARALHERAASLLQVVFAEPLSPQGAMQARYLEIFVADIQQVRDEMEVLSLGEGFLRDYPESHLAGEVRMKLGEVYLRRGDSANAEVQFATLAEQQPEGPLVEKALFLAGQCASNLLNPGSVDRALAYWDKVAGGKGALRWKARYQQAAVKSRLGEEAEGAVLFELVMKAPDGVSSDLRLAALCGRADALLSLAKRTSASLDEALSAYRALAEDAEATPMWRNQALYKIGKAVESTDSTRALQSFERVLHADGTVEAGEFFWSNKAGFDAARLHEGVEAWRKAIEVYERLAAMPGPRAQEARLRARQLRLERFIWD